MYSTPDLHNHYRRYLLHETAEEQYEALASTNCVLLNIAISFFFGACFVILVLLLDILLRHIWKLDRQLPVTTSTPTSDELAIKVAQETVTPNDLEAIPVRVYRDLPKSPMSQLPKLGLENCSICLGEFLDGHMVRVLPRCAHMFHKDCIDPWLLSCSVFCPVCRDQVTVGDDVEPNVQNFVEMLRNNVPSVRINFLSPFYHTYYL